MPLTRPTLAQLTDRAIANIDANLPNADGRLPKSPLNILANMLAASVHGLYGYADYLQKQCFITTAEASGLDTLHGAVWGISRKPATKATGSVTFTGTNGASIPLATVVQRADGATYITTDESSIGTLGFRTVHIEATLAGSAGNVGAGATFSLTNPLTGINATAVGTELSGGANAEEDDPYRERLLERVQAPPHGGTVADYERWTKEVANVTRAFATQDQGPGTVTVRFMTDDATANGIPTSGSVDAVEAYLATVKPVTAEVFVEAPSPSAINFNIALNPNTSTVRAAVEASLREHIRVNSTPGGTLLYSQLREAISTTPGEIDHNLVAPSGNVTTATGVISTAGTFSFSSL